VTARSGTGRLFDGEQRRTFDGYRLDLSREPVAVDVVSERSGDSGTGNRVVGLRGAPTSVLFSTVSLTSNEYAASPSIFVPSMTMRFGSGSCPNSAGSTSVR